MAHGNCESMRSRAFTKGRAAFDSDDEYRRALNGEFDDVREDFGYEANEDPDDGEDDGVDAGDLEDLTDEEAVKAELEDLEDRIGGTHFLEVLEKFMQKCSGRGEPPYLPFRPVHGVEHLALFCHGSEALRLRYGAYGLEADRMEGDEVVKTWKDIDEVEVLNDWDDALAELAEEAEETEEDAKDKFFDDTLPDILADRKRGAAFLGFVINAVTTFDDPVIKGWWLPLSERLWLGWDRAKSEFRLKRDGEILATWDEEEFLEKLRETAWDDPDCQDCILGGGLKKAWNALDGAWYDEDEDDLVADSIGKFLAGVEDARKDPRVGVVQRTVAVCDEPDTGRVEMRMAWSRTFPADALLKFSRDGWEETFSGVPLAFLRWWRFGRGDMRW